MWKTHHCYHGGGKHKFEARYEYKPNDNIPNIKTNKLYHSEELQEIITLHTYVHDICVWCGKIAKRGD